jgi:membrane protein DedA with SNARE-associated domain
VFVHLPAGLGYLALAGFVGAESMGAPLPGETALVTAGVLAHQGQLQIALVIPVAAGAAIVGDNIGYLLGAKWGRPLLEHDGPWVRWRRRFLAEGERFFARHGPKAVFLARFVAGARVTAAWLAGADRMPWRTFFLWNALGGICWALAAGLIGYLLGAAGQRIAASAGLAALFLFLLVGAGTAIVVVRRRRRRTDSPGKSFISRSSEPS